MASQDSRQVNNTTNQFQYQIDFTNWVRPITKIKDAMNDGDLAIDRGMLNQSAVGVELIYQGKTSF
jgi:hypothetical protein